jgi:hypothetical protein
VTQNLEADLARITRQAFVRSIGDSVLRESPLIKQFGGLPRMLHPPTRAERLAMRYRRARVYARNVWWALRGKTPDEDTYSDWWL